MRIVKLISQNVKYFSTTRCVAAVCLKPNYGPSALVRSELMNGIRITAAQPTGRLLTACTIMFQAGSRYETHDDLGATHFLRAASTGGGFRSTAFSKLRVLQQNGAYITTTSDRQTVAYTLRCPLNMFNSLKYYLVDTAASCCYHDWEVSDLKRIVREDLSRVHPEQRIMDLVQKAAWAGPLANSVYCDDDRIDSINGETLRSYVSMNYRPSLCSVASVGVPFEETLRIAEKIAKNTNVQEPEHIASYPRAGYEYHDLGRDSDTWIAITVPGCGTCDLQTLLHHAIITSACGSDYMQMGKDGLDRIPQPPLGLMSGNDPFTNYRAFNISYADTGLFGILAQTSSYSAKRTALCAAEFLTSVGELNFSQIEEGKERLQLSLAIHDEDCVKVSEGLALQSSCSIQLDSAESSINMIKAISPEDIIATAKSLSAKCNKMAIAVIGDISVMPADQEIYLRY